MSNAAIRDAIAKSVNRSLRVEGVIRADQLLKSYRRLVSLQIEFPEVDSEGALMKMVKLRIAMRKAVPASAAAELTPIEAEVVAKVVKARKKRAPRKSKAVKQAELLG